MNLKAHNDNIINRAKVQINFLWCLSRINTSSDNMIFIYNSLIRPILETGFALTNNNTKSTNILKVTENTALSITLTTDNRLSIKDQHERAMIATMTIYLLALMNNASKDMETVNS